MTRPVFVLSTVPTYSVMDINTGKIIDFKLVQKGQLKGDLERQACEQLLMDLTNKNNCKIELFLTDRHIGIQYTCIYPYTASKY